MDQMPQNQSLDRALNCLSII